MGLKDLIRRKLKAFRLRRLLIGNSRRRKKRETTSKPSWMTPISHGYQVVDYQWFLVASDDSDCDSVVVQREQFGELELWYFGVSDARIGDGVTKFMQTHFFDKKPKETQIRRKGKEAMKKAYLGVSAKIRKTQEEADETSKPGSVSVMVINGEKLVIANMGEYRAVLCRDGVARHINGKRQQPGKRRWSRRLVSVNRLACQAGNTTKYRQSRDSELHIGAESVDSDTEFVILASPGIWEESRLGELKSVNMAEQVMKAQEAVNLISHLEDPQEAAECLAKEAITRFSRSNISCLVIRFD